MSQSWYAFLHNCVAHPLMWASGDSAWSVRFHDYTAQKAWPAREIKPAPHAGYAEPPPFL